MKKVNIDTDIIKLDQFLKWAGICSSGSEAKFLIKEGNIYVNGEEENRRDKKKKKGDIINIKDNEEIIVQ